MCRLLWVELFQCQALDFGRWHADCLVLCNYSATVLLLLLCLCILSPIFHPTYRVYMPASLSSGAHARLSRSIRHNLAAKTSLGATVTGKRPNAVAALLSVRDAAVGASDSHLDNCTLCSRENVR